MALSSGECMGEGKIGKGNDNRDFHLVCKCFGFSHPKPGAKRLWDLTVLFVVQTGSSRAGDNSIVLSFLECGWLASF